MTTNWPRRRRAVTTMVVPSSPDPRPRDRVSVMRWRLKSNSTLRSCSMSVPRKPVAPSDVAGSTAVSIAYWWVLPTDTWSRRTESTWSGPTSPSIVTVPDADMPSSVASRSEMTLRFAPVSTVKGKGPFPLTVVRTVMRPAGSVAVAKVSRTRGSNSRPGRITLSGEARLCPTRDRKAMTANPAMTTSRCLGKMPHRPHVGKGHGLDFAGRGQSTQSSPISR